MPWVESCPYHCWQVTRVKFEQMAEVDLRIVRRMAGLEEDGTPVSPALARLLITDGLTGLYNRGYFQERLQYELGRVAPSRPLGLMVIDIDRFKAFNDRYGHQVGDRALQEVAQAMVTVCPDTAVACRQGGDEFVVLLPNTSDQEARWLQLQLAQEIARRQVPAGEGRPTISLAASVGLALAPGEGQDAASLFHRADANMYATKRQAAGEKPAPVPNPGGMAPLVGRDDELAAVDDLLRRARDGSGSLVVLGGPPGIGKSRLAAAIGRRAVDQGFVVVESFLNGPAPARTVSRCAEDLAAGLSRRRLRTLARQHWGVRALLTPEAPDENATEMERPGASHLAAGLRVLARDLRRPVIWLLDDIRWADATTLAVLECMAVNLVGRPLLVVAAARTETVAGGLEAADVLDWWARIAHHKNCYRWELPPLSAAAARQLCQWAWGDQAPAQCANDAPALIGGNPLSILQSAAHAGVLDAGDSGFSDAASVFAARLQALSEPTRNVLAAAAVLGEETSLELLQQLALEGADAVRHAVDAAEAAGWFVRAGGRMRFAHPLARETVYQQTPAALRRALHRLAGHLLSAEAAHPSADLARHFDEGGDLLRARQQHLRAGESAEAAFDYAEAAAHYSRYLKLGEATGAMGDDVSVVALKAGSLFVKAEDRTAARGILQYALPYCRTGQERGLALCELALLQQDSLEGEAFAGLTGEAVRLLRTHGPSAALAKALVADTAAQARLGNGARALASAHAAIQVAHAGGNRLMEVLWVAAVGIYLHTAAEIDGARECLRIAEEILAVLPRDRTPRMARAVLNTAMLTARLTNSPRAAVLFRLAANLASGSGDLEVTLGAREWEIRHLLAMGDRPLAQQRLAAMEAMVRRSNSKFRQFCWLELSALAALYGHDLAEAGRYVTLLQVTAKGLGPECSRLAAALQAWLTLVAGDIPDAAEWSPAALLPCRSLYAHASPTLLIAAQVQLRSGSIADAQALVDAARDNLATAYELPWLAWTQGAVHRARGDYRQAAAVFRQAARTPGNAYFRLQAHASLVRLFRSGRLGPGGAAAPQRQIDAHLRAASALCFRLDNHWELTQLEAPPAGDALSASAVGARATRQANTNVDVKPKY